MSVFYCRLNVAEYGISQSRDLVELPPKLTNSGYCIALLVLEQVAFDCCGFPGQRSCFLAPGSDFQCLEVYWRQDARIYSCLDEISDKQEEKSNH